MIFNCHTHIGDAFIKPPKNLSLEKIFAPPHGYKHLMLEKASREKIIEGMKKAINIMENCGTNVFIDFREGGLRGVEMLKEALKERKIKAIILGRPKKLFYDEKEMEELLGKCHGIGISSISDWNEEELQMVVEHVKEKNKIFAMHASENRREDINKILDLKPDFLVHLCKATEDDLNEIKSKKIGVVVCPRANSFFNLSPPIKLLLEKNIPTMLGTDNAMIVEPNIMEEVKYVVNKFKIEKKEAIKMVSDIPKKFLSEILKNHMHSLANESKGCNG